MSARPVTESANRCADMALRRAVACGVPTRLDAERMRPDIREREPESGRPERPGACRVGACLRITGGILRVRQAPAPPLLPSLRSRLQAELLTLVLLSPGPGVVADRASGPDRLLVVVGAAGNGQGGGGRGGVVAQAWQHAAGERGRLAADRPADRTAGALVRAAPGGRRGACSRPAHRSGVSVWVVGGPVRRRAGPCPGGHRRAGHR